MEVLELRGEWITLDQLLKAMGWVGSGGEAHARVEAGQVSVDGKVETRKRAKLRACQVVKLGTESVRIILPSGPVNSPGTDAAV